ncbi:helix-turn-helix transcriptional regulator [Stenotrophomonas maltophilia group sp. RNC7]|nr:helix-turn-helix transcriptional regulator [Stenotrophomonas maltophilia group sp. RNC7]
MKKGDDILTFGSNLRYIRVQRKLTLQDLSQKLNVSINYLSKLEQDRAKLKPEFLPALANVLNIKIEDLYSETPPSIK